MSAIFLVLHVDAQSGAMPPAGSFQDGTALVGFKAGAPSGQRVAAAAAAGAIDMETIGAGTHVLHFGNGRVLQVIQALKNNPLVRYAEPDYLEWPAGAPNDPSFASQWGFQNTGQTVQGVTGTAGADEKAVSAWNLSTGSAAASGVVVAVLDSGVQFNHPDLESNMWLNPGGIGNCPAGTNGFNEINNTCSPMDDDTVYGGHGTHIAGIIGAATNNGIGVSGLNWTTQIMAVKWMPSSGAGLTSKLIKAMQWVISAKQAGVNVRVVNDSGTWVGTAFSQALSDEIDQLGSNDILFVTAAGNTAKNNDMVPRYPCVYARANEICVAASDQNDNLWSRSDYGLSTVDLAAPGVNIYSTLRSTNYGYVSGTSMSASQVSGAAALILSTGYQSVATLKSMILNNVDALPSLTSFVRTGGRLNVCKAVPGCTTAVTATPANTSAPLVVGMAQFGHQLGAWTGSWTGSPTNFAYQWSRCDSSGANCTPLSGATFSTYALLANADVGAKLKVTVTASNSVGQASLDSAPGSVVQAAASSSWSVASTILDQSTIDGQVLWQATPSLPSSSVNNVQFYIDGNLRSTAFSSPYNYHGDGSLDTTQLAQGPHVLSLKAVANDLTTAYYSAAVIVGNPPSITTTSLPSGTQNVAYSTTLAATGGVTPYSWSIVSGTLPDGLSLNSSTGVISGTPTALGTSNFTVKVTDANSETATEGLSIVIATALTITTTSLPSGTQNVAYSTTLAAAGGVTPYSWSIVSGTLPNGLSLNSSTGVISGTPTASGTSNFTVKVTDANSQTATQGLSIVIATGSGGSITLLQSAAAQGTNVTSLSQAFPTGNTAGNLIVVFVRASTTTQTVTISDSAGNTYAQAVLQTQTTNGHQIRIFYARCATSAGNTVRVSFSGTNAHPWLSAFEYAGVSTLDQTAHAQGGGNNLANTGLTPTTTSNRELVFAGLGLPAASSVTVTAGSGFALLLQDAPPNTSRAGTEGKAVAATGQYAGIFTLSGNAQWSAVVATFK